MSKSVAIVYNKKSGSSVSASKLKRWFTEAHFEVIEMIPISDTLKDDLKTHLKASRWIAAVGGDGTVSAVAGIVAGSKSPLIPLPGGTLNNFTKDLGVEQDLQKAIERAAKSKPRQIDIASVNNVMFINNSSIGLYPQSLTTRESAESSLGKWPAAIYAISRALVHFRTYRVAVRGKVVDTPFVFVGNNDYKLESLSLAGRLRLDGGHLSVYVVKSNKRSAFIKIFVAALRGKLDNIKEFDSYLTKEFTINRMASNKKTIQVSHDGEVERLDVPLQYKIHARKLWVVAN